MSNDAFLQELASQCRVASPHDTVLNSECAYTFHTPYTTDQGILVNLNTFMGTIQELCFPSSSLPTSGLFLRIVKNRIEKKQDENELDNENIVGFANEEKEKDDESKNNITKLGIGVDGGFQSEKDKFEVISSYSIVGLKAESTSSNNHDIIEPHILFEIPFNETTKDEFPSQITKSANSIIHHSGLAVQQDLSAWELDQEEVPISKYCETLPFVDNGVKISPDPSDWKCEASGDIENLWLNLSDGYIGGGRKNWDGSGGSNGALDHFQETGEKYPLVVKLGTITQDANTADCYSYAKDEDGPVKIPNLASLLAKRGIMVSAMQKTVKSTNELEVELNATYAFDAITEAGTNLQPVNGPGLQGLQNLGNSCYMNAVCQTLFGGGIPEITNRYGIQGNGNTSNTFNHPLFHNTKANEATTNILCQTAKLTAALTSGVFAGPLPESVTVTDATDESSNPKYRLAPRMFKNAYAKSHCDFKTGQQQDAAHYLQYVLETLNKAELDAESTLVAFDQNSIEHDEQRRIVPTSKLFAFKTVSRLLCSADNLVKYKDGEPETVLSLTFPTNMVSKSTSESPDQKRFKSTNEEETKTHEGSDVPTVSLKACIDHWASPTTVDGLRWPHLDNAIHSATNQNRFGTFPPYLFVMLQRYKLDSNWVPEKIEINVDVPDELDLNYLRSCGPKNGEMLVPEESEDGINVSTTLQNKIKIDDVAIDQLSAMGFSINGCKRALTAVGGSDVEAAMNWIFEHNMDPDFNDPLPEADEQGNSGTISNIDEGIVESLVENLGCFTSDQVRIALGDSQGDAARAADWLFSHMDDLDNAIASLELKNKNAQQAKSVSEIPLKDGDGTYILNGLISHIGKHTGSGHYVCHLKKNGKWVIFNDEKVALSESPPIQHAYIYLFKRK